MLASNVGKGLNPDLCSSLSSGGVVGPCCSTILFHHLFHSRSQSVTSPQRVEVSRTGFAKMCRIDSGQKTLVSAVSKSRWHILKLDVYIIQLIVPSNHNLTRELLTSTVGTVGTVGIYILYVHSVRLKLSTFWVQLFLGFLNPILSHPSINFSFAPSSPLFSSSSPNVILSDHHPRSNPISSFELSTFS